MIMEKINTVTIDTKSLLDKDERLENNSSPKSLRSNKNSPLKGCKILYLGSSVTNGSASQGVSFVEYIAKRNDTEYVKEAANGTTLVEGKNSYIERLLKIDKGQSFDLVICQLSTNDATQNKPLGTPKLTKKPNTNTVCGAIEFIANYVKDTWNCPLIFYTNAYYENENYAKMVAAVNEIARLYDIGVIDLYTDEKFNNISAKKRELYMADNVHPTKTGYLEWWTPQIEDYLINYLTK